MTDSQLQDDVIKTDKDTAEEDSGDSGGLYPYDPTEADIDIRPLAKKICVLLKSLLKFRSNFELLG